MLKQTVKKIIRRVASSIGGKYQFLSSAFNEERNQVKRIVEEHTKGHRFPSQLIYPTHLQGGDWDHLFRNHAHEREIQEWIRRVKSHTMVTYDGLVSLADQVRYCEENNIPGCYVEAGTWKGGTSAIMALANLRFGKTRRQLFLFDSFQGIPEPDQKNDDAEWIVNEMKLNLQECKGRLRCVDALVAAQKDVESLFNSLEYPKEYVNIVPGWFQDTLPKTVNRMGPIAILRLDGDLYHSIQECLNILYPLLVEGGFLVIDDWSLSGARKAVTEYFEKETVRPYMCYADGTVRYFIKPVSAQHAAA